MRDSALYVFSIEKGNVYRRRIISHFTVAPKRSAKKKEACEAAARHHLIVAMEQHRIVGFISAVHYLHPDKAQPELWINEVGVAPGMRGRGAGRALIEATLALGRELQCAEVWVLTDRTNTAAMNLYARTGGEEAEDDAVMFTYRL
jgi:ribosomal protein S18 acetylase RimI-like enzyme